MPIRPIPAVLVGFLALAAACGGGAGDEQASSGGTPPADQAGATPAAPAVPPIDPRQVPADLRHLIAWAQEWGIGDDIARLEKVDGATPEQRAALRRAVTPHQARITRWLDSFGQGVMSDEAASFMYMQVAIEEMTGLP